MRILVSACLLGICCRYDGRNCAHPGVVALGGQHTLIPVCPEQLGGLPTPRAPSEIVGGRVMGRDGQDCTAQFRRGAEDTVRIYQLSGCEIAILKSKSPSCGCGTVYDGTFTGALVPGDGWATKALREAGAPVFTQDDYKL